MDTRMKQNLAEIQMNVLESLEEFPLLSVSRQSNRMGKLSSMDTRSENDAQPAYCLKTVHNCSEANVTIRFLRLRSKHRIHIGRVSDIYSQTLKSGEKG